MSSADLACLSPWARACLPSEVFARVPRAARGGVAHALSRKGTEVVEGGWLSHLPLGVLLRLPQAERHACISFVCKAAINAPVMRVTGWRGVSMDAWVASGGRGGGG